MPPSSHIDRPPPRPGCGDTTAAVGGGHQEGEEREVARVGSQSPIGAPARQVDDDSDHSLTKQEAGAADSKHDDATDLEGKHSYTVLAFYKFQNLLIGAGRQGVGDDDEDDENDPLASLKDELVRRLQGHGALGNVLLATEGINGTVCYPTPPRTHNKNVASGGERDDDSNTIDDDDPIRQYLVHEFPNCMMRTSSSPNNVFWRLRVRIKSEVVTMGVPDLSLVPNAGAGCNDEDVDGDGDVAGEESDHDNKDHGDSGCCGYSAPRRRLEGVDTPGRYVSPLAWNEILQDPTTLVIDTRNEYEIDVGTFEGAVNPHTTSFVEFPSWLERHLQKQQSKGSTTGDGVPNDNCAHEEPTTGHLPLPAITKLAFFCTGGVRCEKATAYAQRLLRRWTHHQGRLNSASERDTTAAELSHSQPQSPLPEVCHLEGGILAYLEAVSPQESLFNGECYVFDNRVAVSHGLQPSVQYVACRACRHPLSKDDVQTDPTNFVEGRQCRFCANDPDRQQRRDRYEMRHRQVVAAEQKGLQHLGSNSADGIRARHRAQLKAMASAAAAGGP